MAHDVFICHSSEDQTIATAACAKLESAGIRCWIAPRDPVPGKDWPPQIKRAIVATKILLLIFSSNSNVSDDVFREVYLAATYKKIILLLKIDDSTLSDSLEYYMGSVHWLDALTPPLEARLDDVSKLIPRLLGTVDSMELAPTQQQPVSERVGSLPQEHAVKTEGRQIYVSYARNDDLPPPGGDGKGFVTTLIACLGHYLTMFGPPKPQIWCDLGAIALADTFDSTLEKALASSGTLLVVLSNNWIHSEYCKRELNLFRQQHESESEEEVKRRIVVLAKNHIEHDARPHLLQGQGGYRFHEWAEPSGPFKELFKHGKLSPEFYDRVEELARDLWQRAAINSVSEMPLSDS